MIVEDPSGRDVRIFTRRNELSRCVHGFAERTAFAVQSGHRPTRQDSRLRRYMDKKQLRQIDLRRYTSHRGRAQFVDARRSNSETRAFGLSSARTVEKVMGRNSAAQLGNDNGIRHDVVLRRGRLPCSDSCTSKTPSHRFCGNGCWLTTASIPSRAASSSLERENGRSRAGARERPHST